MTQRDLALVVLGAVVTLFLTTMFMGDAVHHVHQLRDVGIVRHHHHTNPPVAAYERYTDSDRKSFYDGLLTHKDWSPDHCADSAVW